MRRGPCGPDSDTCLVVPAKASSRLMSTEVSSRWRARAPERPNPPSRSNRSPPNRSPAPPWGSRPVSEPAAAGLDAVRVPPVVAVPVVLAAALGVGEHLVGLVDLLELALGRLVAGIQIGMMPAGQTPKGRLDVLVRGVLSYAQYLVIAAHDRGSSALISKAVANIILEQVRLIRLDVFTIGLVNYLL